VSLEEEMMSELDRLSNLPSIGSHARGMLRQKLRKMRYRRARA